MAQPPVPTPSGLEDAVEFDPPSSAGEAWDIIVERVQELVQGFVENLPLIGLALLIVIVGVGIARLSERGTRRGLDRTGVDAIVTALTAQIVRAVIIVAAILLALAVAGVRVAPALAGLGLVGLAVAFALQSILENFIAGLLLLIRKPFSAGDQIITGDFEGTVEDLDFRVTKLVDYDGEHIIVPNAQVFSNPLVNLTRRGKRRTRVEFGIDYRDDHNAVGDLVADAVADVEGVLSTPAPDVLCTGLGDSAVEFVVMYWTRPDIGSVIHAEDEVLRTVKDTIEGAGMTIPWPMRTLTADDPDAWPPPRG